MPNKKTLAIIVLLLFGLATIAYSATVWKSSGRYLWRRSALTGGGDNAIDGYPASQMGIYDMMVSMDQSGGTIYWYKVDISGGTVESSPERIVPDDIGQGVTSWVLFHSQVSSFYANKIYVQGIRWDDGAGNIVWSKVSGATPALTGVTPWETGTTGTAGSPNVQYAEGEGIDVTISADGTSSKVAIAGEDASTSNKGIALFDSKDFTVNAGTVSAISAGITAFSSATTGTGVSQFSISPGSDITVTPSVQGDTMDFLIASTASGGGTTGASVYASGGGSFTGQENIYISGHTGIQVQAQGTAGVSIFPPQDLQTTGTPAFSGVTPQAIYIDPIGEQAITAATQAIGVTGYSTMHISSDADYTLISTPSIVGGGRSGQILFIHNHGGFDIDLQDNSVLSGSSVFIGRSPGTIHSDSTMTLVYSSKVSGFRIYANPNTAIAGANATVEEVRAGEVLSAGDTVHILSWHVGSSRPIVEKADADAPGKYPALGFIVASLANNQNGEVIILGEGLNLIDTSTAAIEDGIWLSTTPGEVVFKRPTTDCVQKLGEVARVGNANASAFFAFGSGRCNDVPNEFEASGISLYAKPAGASGQTVFGASGATIFQVDSTGVYAEEFQVTSGMTLVGTVPLWFGSGASIFRSGDSLYVTDANGNSVDLGDSRLLSGGGGGGSGTVSAGISEAVAYYSSAGTAVTGYEFMRFENGITPYIVHPVTGQTLFTLYNDGANSGISIWNLFIGDAIRGLAVLSGVSFGESGSGVTLISNAGSVGTSGQFLRSQGEDQAWDWADALSGDTKDGTPSGTWDFTGGTLVMNSDDIPSAVTSWRTSGVTTDHLSATSAYAGILNLGAVGPGVASILEAVLDVTNLLSGTSEIFDKGTDTLDNIPDGSTYKLVTATKEAYILDWESSIGETIHTDNYIEGGPGTDTTAARENKSGVSIWEAGSNEGSGVSNLNFDGTDFDVTVSPADYASVAIVDDGHAHTATSTSALDTDDLVSGTCTSPTNTQLNKFIDSSTTKWYHATILDPDDVQSGVSDEIHLITFEKDQFPSGALINHISIYIPGVTKFEIALEEWTADDRPSFLSTVSNFVLKDNGKDYGGGSDITDQNIAAGGSLFVDLSTSEADFVKIVIGAQIK